VISLKRRSPSPSRAPETPTLGGSGASAPARGNLQTASAEGRSECPDLAEGPAPTWARRSRFMRGETLVVTRRQACGALVPKRPRPPSDAPSGRYGNDDEPSVRDRGRSRWLRRSNRVGTLPARRPRALRSQRQTGPSLGCASIPTSRGSHGEAPAVPPSHGSSTAKSSEGLEQPAENPSTGGCSDA
jgi:hypothetical protein